MSQPKNDILTMPFMVCPYCGHKWQYDDYYKLDYNSRICCPNCDKDSVVSEKYEIVQIRLQMQREPWPNVKDEIEE